MSSRLRVALCLAGAVICGFAWGGVRAQLLNVQVTSNVVTSDQLAAQVAALNSSILGVQNMVPAKCAAVPSMETLNGSTGTATCFVSADGNAPTIVQAAKVTTTSGGAFTVGWAKTFTSSAPMPWANPLTTGSAPVMCNITSSTSTSVSGQCWGFPTTITLPSIALNLLGLVLNISVASPSGMNVWVGARDTTQ